MMRLKILIAVLIIGFPFLNAQVKVTLEPDMILTQNWAMPTLYNPAATGDVDFIRVRGGARLEYFGSHDSPKSFIGTGDSPFKLLGKRIGAGVLVNSNSYDLFRNLLISAQGSYKLQIKNSTLSIGVQIGYFHTKFKGSKYIIYQTPGGGITGPETPGTGGEEGEETEGSGSEDIGGIIDSDDNEYDVGEYPTEDVGAGTFDLAVGLRFTHPKFYVGISAQHLTNALMKMTKEGEEVSTRRLMESRLPMTLYFDAGGNIDINNTLFTLQPSLMIGSDLKKFDGVAVMRATYDQKFTFGLNYRWNRAAGILAGLMIKNFYLGYNWEYDYANHPKGSTGNHELVLGYQFKMDLGGKNTFSHKSIRIM